MATTKKRNLSPKQKPVPKPQQFEVQGLQILTASELNAPHVHEVRRRLAARRRRGFADIFEIAGAGVRINHNETVVKFPN